MPCVVKEPDLPQWRIVVTACDSDLLATCLVPAPGNCNLSPEYPYINMGNSTTLDSCVLCCRSFLLQDLDDLENATETNGSRSDWSSSSSKGRGEQSGLLAPPIRQMKNASACTMCADQYERLKAFYSHLSNKGSICADLVDHVSGM